MGLNLALLHYPMTNKRGAVVTTSVTNFDVHDIARASRTYGVERYYIVTPAPMQRNFVRRIMRHWLEEEGAEYNPTRGDALSVAEVAPDLIAVENDIVRRTGQAPYWVATSAKASKRSMKTEALREMIEKNEQPVCLLFGTGHGLHPEVMELVDAVLEPIYGPTEYNHLSVRSAVSIDLDRLLARREL